MTVRRRHVAIVTCVTVALLGLWLGFRFPSTAHAWPTLSDQEFWDMVVSFSEPGQAFRSLEFRPKGLHFAHVEVPPVDTDNRGRDRIACCSVSGLPPAGGSREGPGPGHDQGLRAGVPLQTLARHRARPARQAGEGGRLDTRREPRIAEATSARARWALRGTDRSRHHSAIA